MRGYRKLPFRFDNAVGAISNDEFVGVDLGDIVSEKTWISTVVVTAGIRDYTVGEGPVTLYVANSDYTDAEIAEAIEADTAWDYGNLVSREHARRKVRMIGVFALNDQGEEVLNDGKPLRVKVGMMLEEAKTLQFGLHATGGNLTAGSTLSVLGHANGWVK